MLWNEELGVLERGVGEVGGKSKTKKVGGCDVKMMVTIRSRCRVSKGIFNRGERELGGTGIEVRMRGN